MKVAAQDVCCQAGAVTDMAAASACHGVDASILPTNRPENLPTFGHDGASLQPHMRYGTSSKQPESLSKKRAHIEGNTAIFGVRVVRTKLACMVSFHEVCFQYISLARSSFQWPCIPQASKQHAKWPLDIQCLTELTVSMQPGGNAFNYTTRKACSPSATGSAIAGSASHAKMVCDWNAIVVHAPCCWRSQWTQQVQPIALMPLVAFTKH